MSGSGSFEQTNGFARFRRVTCAVTECAVRMHQNAIHAQPTLPTRCLRPADAQRLLPCSMPCCSQFRVYQ